MSTSYQFILNPKTGQQELGKVVDCKLCGGVTVPASERQKARQANARKNQRKREGLCVQCDGHGKFVTTGVLWRYMFKTDMCEEVGKLPERKDSLAEGVKLCHEAKKMPHSFENLIAARYAIQDGLTLEEACKLLKFAIVGKLIAEDDNIESLSKKIGTCSQTTRSILKEMIAYESRPTRPTGLTDCGEEATLQKDNPQADE